MAKRTVFIFDKKNNKVFTKVYEFEFHKGNTLVANRKSVDELHEAIKKDGYKKIVEVSRSSILEFKILREDSICSYYIYRLPSGSGAEDKIRYDLVYIKGLVKSRDAVKLALKFDVFTDLAYQGERHQSAARALAIFRYLKSNSLVDNFLENPKDFLELYTDL